MSSTVTFDVEKEIFYERDIPYTKNNEYKQSCNIFFPKTKETSFPILFIVHGGSWSRGDRNHKWFDCYSNMAINFAKKGFCCIVPSYRLSPNFQHPTHVDDLADCILWITKNIDKYKGDPNEIHLLGHSGMFFVLNFSWWTFVNFFDN